MHLNFIIILMDKSFFCDTCKNPGYMDFIIKYVQLSTTMANFFVCLISLLVKFYIHEITILLLNILFKGVKVDIQKPCTPGCSVGLL